MPKNSKTTLSFILDKMLHVPKNEDGFLLVLTMVILIVLTIIGISATNLTRIELQIAGNDRVHNETFYQADGGTEIGMRLAYDNAVCVQTHSAGGFDKTGTDTFRTIGNIKVWDLNFSTPDALAPTIVSDANRHATYYSDGVLPVVDTSPHTNLLFNVSIGTTPGSGLQMVQGYEGLGGGAPSGTHSKFTIRSQHIGVQNSQSNVTLGWQMGTHILNAASSTDCLPIYKN